MKEHYDIGVVGNYAVRNYGSCLTHFALYKTLCDMGYSVLMIDRPNDAPSMRKTKTLNFSLWQNCPYDQQDIAPLYPCNADMKKVNVLCDTFVTGSDQLWSNWLYNNDGKVMTQRFVYNNHKKIAYAASFGKDYIWGSEYDRAEESYYMQQFDYFSVREDSGVKICKEKFGVDAVHVLDPVFLCSKNNYEKLLENVDDTPPHHYCFVYVLDPSFETATSIRKFLENKNLDLIAVSDGWYTKEHIEKLWDVPTLSNAKVEDWLSGIYNSNFVIVDSFHGMCFSIIFQKQFAVIVNQKRGATRFTSLLKQVHLEDRMFSSLEELCAHKDELFKPIDYEEVNKILEKERKRSLYWLNNAIESPKVAPLSAFDILDGRIDAVHLHFDKRIDGSQKLLNERIDKLQKIVDENARLQFEVQELRNSFSYRFGKIVTAPLRKIYRLIKRRKK